MAQIWTCRRPQLRLYTEWDGSNLAELEAAWPTWTFSVNPDGTLDARSESGEFHDPAMAVGTWFTSDGSYEQNPTLTTTVQEAPPPGPSGLVSFAVAADD
jgi:hypothetical protein